MNMRLTNRLVIAENNSQWKFALKKLTNDYHKEKNA